MRHVLYKLITALNLGQPAVLCGIVRNSGSAPRTSGARMVVLGDGSIAGSVGGGALEGKCQEKARELFLGPATFAELDFQLTAVSAAEEGMACGGSASVLLQRIEMEMLPFMLQLQEDYAGRRRPMLLTVLPKKGEPPRLLLLNQEESPDVPGELRSEITRKGRRAPFLLDYQGREIFVEPLVHPGTVHLAGAGHVALAVAKLAAFVGFDCIVMDDRAEFANEDRYPEAKEVRVLQSFARCLENLGQDDYVVIVTRGHLHDRDVLAQALRTKAGYIGMIGSRRKRAAVYESLREEGVTDADLARVHCPIGLAIDADTPEEIALSIVAEMVQVRAKMAT
jgi:xanthine dehydrogenase accessory factor